MAARTSPDEDQVLAQVAGVLGVRVVRRFARGDHGAHEVVDRDGQHGVLKWWHESDPSEAAVRGDLMAAARARGCPMPATLATGRTGGVRYELQELVPGHAPDTLHLDVLDEMLSLIDRLRGAAPRAAPEWWEWLVGGMVEDRSPLCRPSLLAREVGEVAGLCHRARALACAASPPSTVPGDVVHGDFGPANLLVTDAGLAAVLDWQHCRIGEAGYDLITTAWDLAAWPKSAPGVRERLAADIERTTTPDAATLYAAHLVLRNLTWATGTEWQRHIVRTGHAFLDRWARP